VHELVHEMLHKPNAGPPPLKSVRETEAKAKAEAVAFMVGTAIGLNNGRASADYSRYAVEEGLWTSTTF